MVEVFKTDVSDRRQAGKILELLKNKYPEYEINFDLEDGDRILRIAGRAVSVHSIIRLLQGLCHFCEVLMD